MEVDHDQILDGKNTTEPSDRPKHDPIVMICHDWLRPLFLTYFLCQNCQKCASKKTRADYQSNDCTFSSVELAFILSGVASSASLNSCCLADNFCFKTSPSFRLSFGI